MTHNPEHSLSKLAAQYNIHVDGDAKTDSGLTPRLAAFDDEGTTVQHIEKDGADYLSFQIDYYHSRDIRASRTVAVISQGKRTELAYWTKGARSKILDIHEGQGSLILGDPSERITRIFPFDSKTMKQILLPAGYFYTIQAASDSVEPLVVSGFYEPPPDWDALEIPLSPGQRIVEAPEGNIIVPSDFMTVCGAA